MNGFVSAAAVASATAIPDPITADPIASNDTRDFNPVASLARAEEVVSLLRTRYIRKGWKIDDEAAERALSYCRAYAADGSDPDDECEAAMDFFDSHGVSIDWVFGGDIAGLICGVAKNSTRANSIADAELLALGEQYFSAEKRAVELIQEVSRTEDRLTMAHNNKPMPDVLLWRESDAELGLPKIYYSDEPIWSNYQDVRNLRAPKWMDSARSESEGQLVVTIRDFVPSPEARARADEIIAAHAEWSQFEKPPRGHKKLVRERDKAERIAARLLKRVAETPATTIEGLLAKARCAVGTEQDIENAKIDMVGNPAGDMALSIFDDLNRLAKTA